MPLPHPTRRRLRCSAAAFVLAGAAATPAVPQAVSTDWALNSYSLPGGVDTPSAEMLPDGEIVGSVSWSDQGRRTTGVVQIMPRVTAALRYSRIDNVVDTKLGYLKDRSADVRVQVMAEGDGWRPAVAFGLQDFIGTGVYSGEYVVATKHFMDNRLAVSAGIGWGRLAGAARPFPFGETGGDLNASDWFKGPAKPFASLSYRATDRLRLVAEYSNDTYELERSGGATEITSHINLGANYRFGDAYQVSAYTLGGKTFGAQLSLSLNMRRAAFPSGLEPAPAPVRPRVAPGADPEGWSGAWTADPTAQPTIQTALGKALEDEGQVLESMALSRDRAEVRIENRRYPAQAEAIGRTARLMTRALPPSVETFVITSMRRGLPASSVVLRRSDVERLENTEAGRIAAAAQIVDAPARAPGLVASPGVYPRTSWSLSPYVDVSTFSNTDKTPFTFGARLSASYEPAPGFVLSGTVQQKIYGNGVVDPPGPLTAPYRVRSDAKLYSDNDGPTIERLTAAWYAKPSNQVYTRVTAGLLEPMYGGVSAEVLWKPADRNWALGAEVNRVRKRDYDKRFTFQDYETTTGFVSAYYDFGQGYLAQLDVGRYLAKDVGATLTLSREFANGWKVGAYVTKTDLSAEEFGEGSYDKGVTVSIPVAWALGTPTRQTLDRDLSSIRRDGGAQVNVDGRLYDTVRTGQSGQIYQGWGRFWR